MNDKNLQYDFEALEAAREWLVQTVNSEFANRRTPAGHPMLNEFLRVNILESGKRFDVWTANPDATPRRKINHDPVPFGRALLLKQHHGPRYEHGCLIKEVIK